MKRSTVTAALKAAGISAAQIATVETQLTALEAAEGEGGGEGGGADTGADTQTGAETETGADTGTGGDTETGDDTSTDASASASLRGAPGADALSAPDGATVLGILGLPEAKGRDTLAKALAGQPGMTLATAKTLLAAAPKAQSLTPQDPPISPTGGTGETGALAEGRALAQQLTAHRRGGR